MRYAASRAGVSHATWSRIERGRSPSRSTPTRPPSRPAAGRSSITPTPRGRSPNCAGGIGRRSGSCSPPSGSRRNTFMRRRSPRKRPDRSWTGRAAPSCAASASAWASPEAQRRTDRRVQRRTDRRVQRRMSPGRSPPAPSAGSAADRSPG
ncbi:hypothetical protein [Actinoplanes sp. KI2]|uniref:hypothetical protein n=1 Tax=Actinoplanes sp. KI2 TaxID=2983315 RepID=UPI0039839929